MIPEGAGAGALVVVVVVVVVVVGSETQNQVFYIFSSFYQHIGTNSCEFIKSNRHTYNVTDYIRNGFPKQQDEC